MLTSQMQWRGVPPMLVLAVDVLLGGQLLHSIQVALLGCLEQSHLPSQQVGYVTVLLVLDHVQRSQVVTVTAVQISTILGGEGSEKGARRE